MEHAGETIGEGKLVMENGVETASHNELDLNHTEDGEIQEDNIEKSQGDEEDDNIEYEEEKLECGLGVFINNNITNLADHAEVDKKKQEAEKQHDDYDEEYEKAQKEQILTELTTENLKNQGLPTQFVSRKEVYSKRPSSNAPIFQTKAKNIQRVQRYYGDIYEDDHRYPNDQTDYYQASSSKYHWQPSSHAHSGGLRNQPNYLANIADTPPMPEVVENLGKNDFYCEVCELRMNGIQSFQSHVNGTKHHKKLKKLQESKLVPDYSTPTCPFPDITEYNIKPKTYQSNIEEKLQAIDEPMIGVQFILEYFHEGDKTGEPKYVCELCDKKCDFRTVVCHLGSYIHRWSYIKLKYPIYADRIRDYGTKKTDRNEALERYSSKIEEQEGRPRQIKASMVVGSEKILTMDDAARAAVTQSSNINLVENRGIKVIPINRSSQLDEIDEFLKVALPPSAHSTQSHPPRVGSKSWQLSNMNKTLFPQTGAQSSNRKHLLSPAIPLSHNVVIANDNNNNNNNNPINSAGPSFEDEEEAREFKEFLMFKKLKRMGTFRSDVDLDRGDQNNERLVPTVSNFVRQQPPIDHVGFDSNRLYDSGAGSGNAVVYDPRPNVLGNTSVNHPSSNLHRSPVRSQFHQLQQPQLHSSYQHPPPPLNRGGTDLLFPAAPAPNIHNSLLPPHNNNEMNFGLERLAGTNTYAFQPMGGSALRGPPAPTQFMRNSVNSEVSRKVDDFINRLKNKPSRG